MDLIIAPSHLIPVCPAAILLVASPASSRGILPASFNFIFIQKALDCAGLPKNEGLELAFLE